ncbi:MAG: serine/threonine protein kinase [Actinobacteria bacterium]|nr:serine/threonine protein kinase [Actinomycetota bacterium]
MSRRWRLAVTNEVRSEPGELAAGALIGSYRIQEQIGRGGMAVVYRALDLRHGRPVALKVLDPKLGQDEAFRERFVREFSATAGVDHQYIVPVFEAGESGDLLFIAMRYVSGGDVRSLLDSDGPLDPGRTAVIASQVAAALDAAHAHGLVHRDVKPGNILLGETINGVDHVYLSDFGLSKHALASATLTSTGQFFGTLDYVAPEQIQGRPVDGRADQYGLACTVVEMLTGTPPFQSDDTRNLMWAQLEDAPPRVTERRAELPPIVDRVIARALEKSPGRRYPTCQEFAAALTAACAAPSARKAVTVRFPDFEPQFAHNFRTPGAPARSDWPGPDPRAHGNRRGAWLSRPSQLWHNSDRLSHRTGLALAIAIVITLIVLGLALAVAYRLSHRDHGTTSLAPTIAKMVTARPGNTSS